MILFNLFYSVDTNKERYLYATLYLFSNSNKILFKSNQSRLKISALHTLSNHELL